MGYPKPSNEPIALVGSSCRFSGGANSPSKLWNVLSRPQDLSRPVPSSRFSAQAFFHDDPEHHGTSNSRLAYWLDQDHRAFDAAFFNITPKEAEAMDPQQRLLLEVVYEALESAGYSLDRYAGQSVGVYTGIMTSDYHTLSERDELNASQYVCTGTSAAMVSNRLSHFFDFRGPSLTIDTACSASLVALHQAALSLRSAESVMACVAGANMMLTPEQFIAESSLHMLSPTGHCRMWDRGADGYARGEGVAALFVKTLSRALVDGDHIHAIFRETAVNSDGRTMGITMPNPEAQRSLIEHTYLKSGLDPRLPEHRPQYCEAHGTGTRVGDPREARAIAHAFFGDDANHVAKSADGTRKLLVGSVKTVIGHTEGAAGLAGVLKVVQAMEHATIPSNLHLDALHPDLVPFCSHLHVVTETTRWPAPPPGQPLRASVNCFGFGGTNAHAIVEKYQPEVHGAANRFSANPRLPPYPISTKDLPRPPVLPLLISAASKESLVGIAKSLLSYVAWTPQVTTQELAWHLYTARTAHAFTFAITPEAGPAGRAMQDLQSWIEKAERSSPAQSGANSVSVRHIARCKRLTGKPCVLGIFTGQGAQYVGMSKGLLLANSVFRQAIVKMDEILQGCDDPPTWSLQHQILAGEQDSRIREAEVAQSLCTAIQLALVDLLTSVGVSFHCVVGHSAGEIGAAYAAGRISKRDAVLVAYYRGRHAHLAAGTNGCKGAMLVCGLSGEDARRLCARSEFHGRIGVAAYNSPTSTTLSGDADAVDAVLHELQGRAGFVRKLPLDTAYHSFHMRQSAEAYSKALKKMKIGGAGNNMQRDVMAPDAVAWVSSVYGCQIDMEADDDGVAAPYWEDNMIKPVLFDRAVKAALEQFGQFDCAIEVGPHPALKSVASEIMQNTLGRKLILPYHGLLQRGMEAESAFAAFLGFMCTRFGPSSVDLRRFVQNSSQPQLIGTRLHNAPSYVWDHTKIHWRESRLSHQYHFRRQPPHELLGVRCRDDNQLEMRWRNILKMEHIPWIQGHKFQGQVLLPASAYCVMALDAARTALGGRRASIVELHDLEFLSGITVEPCSLGVETLFTLSTIIPPRPHSAFQASEIEAEIEAEISLTSVPVTSSNMLPMKKNFRAKLRIILEEPHPGALPSLQPRGARAEMLSVSIPSFYQVMEGIGLVYAGPFEALTSINRRFNYAEATLSKTHPQDSTRLQVSPAFLDSCFQVTFATFACPGDKALWTPFLPTKISKIQFNTVLCGGQPPSDRMKVESYLSSFKPYSARSPASITADLCIKNEAAQTEILVEGLVVSSFATTKPEDDYELYLHTVLDIDPDYEFVTAPSVSATPSPFLIESCERVAQLNRKHFTSFQLADTPPASPPASSSASASPAKPENSKQDGSGGEASEMAVREMDQFIAASPYSHALEFIRSSRMVGMAQESKLPSILESVAVEAQMLHDFRVHVGRVVQQIAHRYARMHVLDLTFSQWSLTGNILDGLQDTFASYTLTKTWQQQRLFNRCHSLRHRKRVLFCDVDLDTDVASPTPSTDLYDLVVLSTWAFTTFSPSGPLLLQRVRRMMKDRAFLVLVHAPVSVFRNQFVAFDQMDHQDQDKLNQNCESRPAAPSSSEVTWLLDQCGDFLPATTCSHQIFPPGFSLTIRQAREICKKPCTKTGLAKTRGESILIVGQRGALVDSLTQAVRTTRNHQHGQDSILFAERLENVSKQTASSCTVAILLVDLVRPVCTSMSKNSLCTLKSLMQPGKTILWVTVAVRRDPATAASLGLTRTLKAENPSVILQVLDFDETVPDGRLIADQMAWLLAYRDHMHVQVASEPRRKGMLFSFEPEIHMEKGKRLVPRVCPYRPAIDRLNAYRRQVITIHNSLETPVVLDTLTVTDTDGSTRFEARNTLVDNRRSDMQTGSQSTVNVEYSSLSSVSVGSRRVHICVGRAVNSGHAVVGLAACAASIVRISDAQSLSRFSPDHCRALAAVLPPMVAACEIVNRVVDHSDLILMEPDPMLLCCIRAMFPHGRVRRTLKLHVWTTDAEMARMDHGTTYIHPRSNARELRRAIPRTRPVVIDFLSQGSPISKVTQSMSKDVEYLRWSSFSGCSVTDCHQSASDSRSWWLHALEMSFDMMSRRLHLDSASQFLTPAQVVNRTDSASPFTIVDWKADRLVPVRIRPLVESGHLNSDRTYVLVGLTRDLGQSICRLFIEHGARNIVVASRNPDPSPAWVSELNSEGAEIRVERLDVTNLEEVMSFKAKIPDVGGIINGAMVLDDRVFNHMDVNTWTRVMGPKAVGSSNLDKVFGCKTLEFFIMTSSFAAIGGHAGQSNYAAANMFMNGLAANRRRRGLVGSVLNIGVIYGLGLLARERQDVYHGLEKEGYPPISERDIHHMVLEAIVAGRPVPGQVADLTTGLARYALDCPNPMHWHQDQRFCHYAKVGGMDDTSDGQDGGAPKSIKELVKCAKSVEAISEILMSHFCRYLESALQFPTNSIAGDNGISQLGVDSLAAVEIRNWVYRTVEQDVPIMKIMGSMSISKLCHDLAAGIMGGKEDE